MRQHLELFAPLFVFMGAIDALAQVSTTDPRSKFSTKPTSGSSTLFEEGKSHFLEPDYRFQERFLS